MTQQTFDYDLFVIGAGSGGVRLARMSAQTGAKVAVAEESQYGGTCVNVGCVPKKLFVYASDFAHSFHEAEGFGLTSENIQFDWPRLRDNKNAEIERLNGIYANLLNNAGVEIIDGRAVISGEHEVEINGQKITAKHIVVATGGKPVKPSIPGGEHAITSNDVFFLDEFPKHAIVVGGGYIALEFAGIFNGLNVDTHLVHRREDVLRGFDEDVRGFLKVQLENRGITMHLPDEVVAIEKLDSGRFNAKFKSGQVIETDLVMFATGRVPNVQDLGLEALNIEMNPQGGIVVDDNFSTNVPSIFAIGDVISRIALTPVALAEGTWLTQYLFSDHKPTEPLDYSNVASAVFSQPNYAGVGLTEAQAKAQYTDLDVYDSRFRPMKHTISGNAEQSYMKLIVATDSQKVVGVHMVGPDAGEIIQGIAIAVKMGATKQDFDATIGIHPTAAEEFVTMRTKRSAH